jgi:hypothetical protein
VRLGKLRGLFGMDAKTTSQPEISPTLSEQPEQLENRFAFALGRQFHWADPERVLRLPWDTVDAFRVELARERDLAEEQAEEQQIAGTPTGALPPSESRGNQAYRDMRRMKAQLEAELKGRNN